MSLCAVSGCICCPLLVLDVTWFCKANPGCVGWWSRDTCSFPREIPQGAEHKLGPAANISAWPHEAVVRGARDVGAHLHSNPLSPPCSSYLQATQPKHRSSNPCPAWCACAGTYSAYLDTGITRNPGPFLLSSQQPLPECWPPTGATGLLTQSQHSTDPARHRHRRHPPELGAKILSGAKTHSLLPLHESLLQAESSGTGDAALSDSSAGL